MSVGVDVIEYGGIDYSGAMTIRIGHGSGIVFVQRWCSGSGRVPVRWCVSQFGQIPPHSPCTPARGASHLPTQQPQHNSPVFTRYRGLHHHPSTVLQPLFKSPVALHFHPTHRLPPPHSHLYPLHWAIPAQNSEFSQKWKIGVTSRGTRSFAKTPKLRRRMKSSTLSAHQMAHPS